MLNHIVLAALIPIILAKPIVAPRDGTAQATSTAAARVGERQISGDLYDKLAGSLLDKLAPPKSSKISSALPSVTPFLNGDEEPDVEELTSAPSFIVSTPTSAISAVAAEPTTPSNSSSSATKHPNAVHSSSSCDCIAECADEQGPPSSDRMTASQMSCIQSCAKSCDEDDDKAKKSDLLGSLGLGPRQLDNPKQEKEHHHWKMPKFHAHGKSEWEDCMDECSTNNCQSIDQGDLISQCGDTSCEHQCMRFKKEGEADAVFPGLPTLSKKQFIAPPDSVFWQGPPSDPPMASASGDFDFRACMQNCSTNNCQSADLAGVISQCGDTHCESQCREAESDFNSKIQLVKKDANPPVFGGPARVKKPSPPVQSQYPTYPTAEEPKDKHSKDKHSKDKHSKQEKKPHHDARAVDVPAVPAVPAVPNANGLPSDPTIAGSGSKEFDACMSQCSSHNCQTIDQGDHISQCGSTSCEQQCRHLKSDAAASLSVPKPDGPHRRPINFLDAATMAAKAESDRKNIQPIAGAEESKEFQDCMTQCTTDNCQSADLGGVIAQCGDTDCSSTCARFRSDKTASIVG